MSTKLYLPSSGTAPVTPVFGSSWEDTSIASRLPCYPWKTGKSMTTVDFTDADATDKDVLFRQWISPTLKAQTIGAQTINIVYRASETDAGNNLFTSAVVKLVNGSLTNVGNFFGSIRDNTEVSSTSLTNRRLTGTTTSLTASAGYRIVIELGLSGDPDVGKTHSGSIRIGDSIFTDLPLDDTETNDFCPYVEFATSNILFESVETSSGIILI